MREGVSFCCITKMNSFELCNDSEVYSRYAIRGIMSRYPQF